MAQFSDYAFNNFIKGFFTTDSTFSNDNTTDKVVCLSNGSTRWSDAGYLSLKNSGSDNKYLSMSFNSAAPISIQNNTGGYFEENSTSSAYAVDSLRFYYNSKEVSRIFFGSYEPDLSKGNAYTNSLIFSGTLKQPLSVNPQTTPKIAKKGYTEILHPDNRSPVD